MEYRKDKTMGKYFGTDGFRGEANVTLTFEHAYQIGRFLGWYYAQCKEEGEKCKLPRYSEIMEES